MIIPRPMDPPHPPEARSPSRRRVVGCRIPSDLVSRRVRTGSESETVLTSHRRMILRISDRRSQNTKRRDQMTPHNAPGPDRDVGPRALRPPSAAPRSRGGGASRLASWSHIYARAVPPREPGAVRARCRVRSRTRSCAERNDSREAKREGREATDANPCASDRASRIEKRDRGS